MCTCTDTDAAGVGVGAGVGAGVEAGGGVDIETGVDGIDETARGRCTGNGSNGSTTDDDAGRGAPIEPIMFFGFGMTVR